MFRPVTDLSSISLLVTAKGCCTTAFTNAVNCLAYVWTVGSKVNDKLPDKTSKEKLLDVNKWPKKKMYIKRFS